MPWTERSARSAACEAYRNSLVVIHRSRLKLLLLIVVSVHPGLAESVTFTREELELGGQAAVSAAPGKQMSIQPYLSQCSRDASINLCATKAAAQAKAAGVPLYFPPGIFPLTDWEPPCPLTILGAGQGKTIFRRPANSGGIVIAFANCGGLRLSNLTIDGNKTENAAVSYTVVLNRSWNSVIERVEITNSKGSGSALTLQSTADDSKNTRSMFSELNIHDNDGNGVFFQEHAGNWVVRDSVIRNNGADGVAVIDYEFPPVGRQFSNCAIVHNRISHNGKSGISLTSGIVGGTPALATNGPFDTVRKCRIADNQVDHNTGYGIIMAGGVDIEIANNQATYNGTGLGSVVAGINSALCTRCDVHDNLTAYNDFYGIDAGGAVDTVVRRNTVSNNGNAAINSGNGINCGACQHVDIKSNLISGNGWIAGGAQIHITTYDGGTSGFSMSAQDVKVTQNHFICTNGNQVGLLVLSDPPNTTVEDNRAEGCAPFKGYVLHLTRAEVHRNMQDNWAEGSGFTPSIADPVYPDAVESILWPSIRRSVASTLKPHFYSTNYHTVYAIVVTDGGSGYSILPTVKFIGGCRKEPTGFVFQDNAGHVVGVNLTSFGYGCISPPRVLFADDSGSGAAAMAYVLTSLPIDGRTLAVLWPPGTTVVNNANDINLLSDVSFTVPDGGFLLSTLRGENGHWTETARTPMRKPGKRP